MVCGGRVVAVWCVVAAWWLYGGWWLRGGDGVANITFDEQLDAFEFEQTQNVDQQLSALQANGLADIKIWMR